MCCNSNYDDIIKKIKEHKNCMPKYLYCLGATGPIGPQGPTGPTGPSGVADTITIGNVTTGEPGTEASVTDVSGGPNHVLDFVIPRGFDGNNSDSFCCFCVQQMRNIIEQIINLYPDNQLVITLEGGDAIIGRLGAITLGPSGKAGVVEINGAQPNLTQLLSICSIDTITINNATYNDTITYLTTPEPTPTGCCADCDAAIRSRLPVGTNDILIIANTQVPSRGDVIKNEYGMIVLEDSQNNSISFISTCRINLVYPNNNTPEI